MCCILSAIALNEPARLPISSARSTSVLTVRSPWAMPSLAAVIASKGRVRRLLISQPTTAASSTAPTPASSQAMSALFKAVELYAGPSDSRTIATACPPSVNWVSTTRSER